MAYNGGSSNGPRDPNDSYKERMMAAVTQLGYLGINVSDLEAWE